MLSRAEGALYSSGPVRQPSAVFLICIVDTFSFQNSPLYMNLKPFFRNMLVWVILRKWIYVRTYILNTDIFLLQKIDVFLLNLNFFFFSFIGNEVNSQLHKKMLFEKETPFRKVRCLSVYLYFAQVFITSLRVIRVKVNTNDGCLA